MVWTWRSLLRISIILKSKQWAAKWFYGQDAMPTIDFRVPLVKSREDLKKLKTPDFHRDGRLPYALETYRTRGEKGSADSAVLSAWRWGCAAIRP